MAKKKRTGNWDDASDKDPNDETEVTAEKDEEEDLYGADSEKMDEEEEENY